MPDRTARRRTGPRSPVPRTWAWERLAGPLGHGPLKRGELAYEVYGDDDVRARAAVGGLLRRLVGRGLVLRVGYGWYALPGRTDAMRRVTIEHARRMLARGRYTVRQLAARLDTPVGTINYWLSQLRRRGEPIAASVAPPRLWTPRRVAGDERRPYPTWWFWIEEPRPSAARGGAACHGWT